MTNTIKVLLVDDMDIIMDIMISHLEMMGEEFIFLKASNGREACKIAQQAQPDLIIMDWEMPQMNGIEALALLKKNSLTKDIPVIISSGFSESTNVREALETGAIDYIRKPIDSIELIARVRSVLTLTSSFTALKEKKIELEQERQKVNKILHGIIPPKVLKEIKETGHSKPKRYKDATVMFTDLVGFTEKTTKMSPKRLINELNDIFSSFDKIITKNSCTRIKTIGDAYLSVSGLPEENKDHAKNMMKAAIELRDYIRNRNKTNQLQWEITTGINSGDIIGSLIGLDNYLFDIFGKNVNTAARIQNQCSPMGIFVSDSTYQLTKNDYRYKEIGKVSLKGMNNIVLHQIIDN
ncbi:adenylate/guanylate cyclase domain-containing response regulator [Labilibacter sediminis]|nr:adenylate/guanylate cyclase domain-containing response regulator [Labilibacter sediminis]